HPRGFSARRRCLGVVRPRDANCLEALERGLVARGAEVRRQVRVVEARPVRPREVTARVGPRPERDGRVAVRNEAVLEVPRQRSDWPTGYRLTACVWTRNAQTVAGAPACVRWLRPVVARVEREVDA